MRNAALVALGMVVIVTGLDRAPPGPLEWLATAGSASQAVAALVLVAGAIIARLAWLLNELMRSQGRLLLRLDALEAAAVLKGPPAAGALDTAAPRPDPVRTAPAFRLDGLHGEVTTLQALLARGRPVLLTFIDPGCGACDALTPDITRWQRDGEELTVAVIGRGGAESMRRKLRTSQTAARHVVRPSRWRPTHASQAGDDGSGAPAWTSCRSCSTSCAGT